MKRFLCLVRLAVLCSLVCAAGCAGGPRPSSGHYVDDAVITSEVQSDFAVEPSLAALRIHVETFHGQVLLSGFVRSESEARRAVSIASHPKKAGGRGRPINRRRTRTTFKDNLNQRRS